MTTLVPTMRDVSCDPHDYDSQFRSDWRYLEITIDGVDANPARFCKASYAEGFIEHYVYEDGDIVLNGKNQPKREKMFGTVSILAPEGYSVCGDCRRNWKHQHWWEIAA